MRRGHWAAIATAAVVAAAAAVTAGWGGGAGNALAIDPVAASATKTQSGAAHVRFTLAFSTPQLQGGKTVRLRGTGAIDGTSAELTIGGLGPVLRQSVGSGGPSASAKEIFLDQNGDYVLYTQLGLLASKLPGGQHWIELDLSKLGQSAGFDLGTLLSGSHLQPGDILSMLKTDGAKVRDLGPSTVDGVAATRYRVTVDVAKALEANGLTSPLLGAAAASMPAIPADVWIGKDGLVHRIRISLAGEQGMPLRLGLTVDIYDYGADVAIAAPASSNVFDATQLAAQGFSGASH